MVDTMVHVRLYQSTLCSRCRSKVATQCLWQHRVRHTVPLSAGDSDHSLTVLVSLCSRCHSKVATPYHSLSLYWCTLCSRCHSKLTTPHLWQHRVRHAVPLSVGDSDRSLPAWWWRGDERAGGHPVDWRHQWNCVQSPQCAGEQVPLVFSASSPCDLCCEARDHQTGVFSLPLFLFVAVSFSQPVFLSFSFSLSLSSCLPVCLSLCLSLCLCLPVCLSLPLCIAACICLSAPYFLSLSVLFSLFLSVRLSLLLSSQCVDVWWSVFAGVLRRETLCCWRDAKTRTNHSHVMWWCAVVWIMLFAVSAWRWRSNDWEGLSDPKFRATSKCQVPVLWQPTSRRGECRPWRLLPYSALARFPSGMLCNMLAQLCDVHFSWC